MIAMTFLQKLNTTLNVLILISILVIGWILSTMMARQRRDQADGSRLLRAVATYASMQEEDHRKFRHAIKNLVAVLGLEAKASELIDDTARESLNAAADRVIRLAEVVEDQEARAG